MTRFVLTNEARSDLNQIWGYIAEVSEPNADKVLADIIRSFSKLTKFPEMGRERTELAPLIRSFPIGKYIIFYRSGNLGIAIIRVLHGSRDIDGLF